jgi:tetratricopeptide (TPR) repeat protein/WD40 repeat protein
VDSNKLYVWDVAGRKVLQEFSSQKGGAPVLGLTHRGDLLASTSGWAGGVRLWHAQTGQELLSLPALGDRFTHATPDGRLFGAAQNGTKLRILEGVPGQARRTLVRDLRAEKGKRYHSPSVHPGGRLLVVGMDNGVGLWDLADGREVGFLDTGHAGTTVAFEPSGDLLTYSAAAGLLRWSVRVDAQDPSRLRLGPPRRLLDVRESHGLGFSRDGRVLAAATGDSVIVFHADASLGAVRLGPEWDMTGVAVSPDGRYVATSSHHGEGGVKVWEAVSGKLVANPVHGKTPGWPLFSPDGRWLISGARWFEVGSWRAVPGVPGWPGGCISADGLLLAGGGPEAGVGLFHARTGRLLARLDAPDQGRVHLNFNHDATLLIGIDADNLVIYVWDLRWIRQQLAELGLDWDAPPYPPARPEGADPNGTPPLQVELVGVELATDRQKMAEHETRSAVAQLAVNPFDAAAHSRLGRGLSDAGKLQPAFAHLTAALAFRPELYAARAARAEAAFRLGRWADVVADATRCLEKTPSDDYARFLRAQAEMGLKHYAKAVGDLDVLAKAYPSDAQLYDLRARCHEALGKPDLAKADRAQALKLRDPTALNKEAWQLVTGPAGQRDPARALELIQAAVKQQPGNAMFLNTLGVVQYRNGRYEEALATLEKSLAAGKGQYDAFDLFFLAMCHAKLGDPAKAMDCFDRAVRWRDGQKGLSAAWVEELRAFRAEAEVLLKGKAAPFRALRERV